MLTKEYFDSINNIKSRLDDIDNWMVINADQVLTHGYVLDDFGSHESGYNTINGTAVSKNLR